MSWRDALRVVVGESDGNEKLENTFTIPFMLNKEMVWEKILDLRGIWIICVKVGDT